MTYKQNYLNTAVFRKNLFLSSYVFYLVSGFPPINNYMISALTPPARITPLIIN